MPAVWVFGAWINPLGILIQGRPVLIFAHAADVNLDMTMQRFRRRKSTVKNGSGRALYGSNRS